MTNVTDRGVPDLADRDDRHSAGSRRPRRARAGLVISLVLLLCFALLAVGGAWLAMNRLTGDIPRMSGVFDPIPESERPARPTGEQPGAGGLTFLLVGVDRVADVRSESPGVRPDEAGAPTPAWQPGEVRPDALLVVHVTGGRDASYVVSVPRDSWVEIPGHGTDTIDAAYTQGGPTLLVRTVERLTGLRVDHLAVVDWAGVADLTDALGGVTMTVDEELVAKGQTVPPGTHTVTGDEALAYVGEQQADMSGDLDRLRRQQTWIGAVTTQLLAGREVHDPGTIARLAEAVGQTTTVDDTLSNPALAKLALELRNLRTGDVTFLTVPTLGVGTAGDVNITRYDHEAAAELWDAVRSDSLEAWLQAHPDAVLGRSVG